MRKKCRKATDFKPHYCMFILAFYAIGILWGFMGIHGLFLPELTHPDRYLTMF